MIFYVGAFFGFGPMQLMLEDEGAFAQLCNNSSIVNNISESDPNDPASCNAQSRTLQFVSFIATILAQLMTPVFGEVSDRFGPFVLQVMVSLMGCSGISVVLLSSLTRVYELLYLAFILIGFMSMASAPMIMAVAQLYDQPSSRRRVISSLNCLWDVGGGVGYWILWFISFKISFAIVMGFYLMIGCLVYAMSTVLWKLMKSTHSNHEKDINTSTTESSTITASHPRTSFIQQCTSTRFLILTLLFTVHCSRIVFTLTSSKDFLSSLGDDKTGNRYLTILSLLSPVAVLGLPLVDFFVNKFGYIISLQIVNAVAIMHGIILVTSRNLNIQIIGFILLALYRCFTFAIILSYLEVVVEKHALGKLTGVISLSPGLLQLVNLPLTNWALGPLDGNYFWPNMIYIGFVVPCILGVCYLSRLGNRALSSTSPLMLHSGEGAID
jgi:hypothetical protein